MSLPPTGQATPDYRSDNMACFNNELDCLCQGCCASGTATSVCRSTVKFVNWISLGCHWALVRDSGGASDLSGKKRTTFVIGTAKRGSGSKRYGVCLHGAEWSMKGLCVGCYSAIVLYTREYRFGHPYSAIRVRGNMGGYSSRAIQISAQVEKKGFIVKVTAVPIGRSLLEVKS